MDLLEHTPRRIAILRANGLGDFLMATPALRALAKGFPGAEIVFLTLPWLRDFIAGRYPYLRRVEAIPPYPKINEPDPGQRPVAESAEAFFARMRAEQFDLAIQMHGGGANSNPFVAKLGAAHTLGLTTEDAMPLETNLRYYYYQSEVVRYLELVGKLGIAWDGLDIDVPILDRDRAGLAEVYRPGAQGYAILHVGAGDVRRRWPVERFARVGEQIHDRWGYELVLTGRQDEREVIERLKALCRAPFVDLCGRLHLGAMVALVHGASLLVSNDTGPTHMAYAMNVPSVVIFWCGNLINSGPFRRDRFRPLLSWTLACPTCGAKGRCDCLASWVAGVSADEVLAQVEDLLRHGA